VLLLQIHNDLCRYSSIHCIVYQLSSYIAWSQIESMTTKLHEEEMALSEVCFVELHSFYSFTDCIPISSAALDAQL
jgi:hypothetical protein